MVISLMHTCRRSEQDHQGAIHMWWKSRDGTTSGGIVMCWSVWLSGWILWNLEKQIKKPNYISVHIQITFKLWVHTGFRAFLDFECSAVSDMAHIWPVQSTEHKSRVKIWLSGRFHETQPIPGTVSNPLKCKCSFPTGWQGSGPWSQQALRQFSRIRERLSRPLIWVLSLSPVASVTDAAAVWSTQLSPWWGETMKWPSKLHCNHAQLKTTRKCLPYA